MVKDLIEKLISGPEGFSVEIFGFLSVRSLEDGRFAVSFNIDETAPMESFERIFDHPGEAVDEFLRIRREKQLGADYEKENLVALKTGIKADVPTKNNNLYSRDALESLISSDSVKERIARGWEGGYGFPRDSDEFYPKTHYVRGLRILDSGELVADIEFMDNDDAKKIVDRIENPKALPIVIRDVEDVFVDLFAVQIEEDENGD